jgi:enoyl-[acyl-carrier-protein] reductase (NADH)
MASIAKRENSSVEEVMKGFAARIPMRRLAEPDNVADVVVFLTSERAGYLTGLCIPVDGGPGLIDSKFIEFSREVCRGFWIRESNTKVILKIIR